MASWQDQRRYYGELRHDNREEYLKALGDPTDERLTVYFAELRYWRETGKYNGEPRPVLPDSVWSAEAEDRRTKR